MNLLLILGLAVLAYFVYTGFFQASGPLSFLNQYSSGQAGAY